MVVTHSRGKLPSAALAGPDTIDRALSLAAAFLCCAVVVAAVRGSADWGKVSWQVWVHLALITLALVLTPVILMQRRGTRRHKRMGYVWMASLAIASIVSFDIRQINAGQFSPIHILSVAVPILLLRALWQARQGNLRSHRMAIRLMTGGALLLAGFFTFPFGRMLGNWLLG